MLSPIIKRGTDLSQEEVAELNQMIRRLHHELPEDHIQVNHIQKTNPLFYLYKVEGRIVACQAYTLLKVATPFSRKPLSVIYINISYKDDTANAHIKNFAKLSNLTFIRKHIGRFWYLKKFLLIFETINPKLVERVSDVFGTYYPTYDQAIPKEVSAFAKDFCVKYLGLGEDHVDDALFTKSTNVWNPVSPSDWEKLYQSSNPLRDQFFKENGVFVEDNGQKVLVGRLLFYIGIYSFGGLLRKRWNQLMRR